LYPAAANRVLPSAADILVFFAILLAAVTIAIGASYFALRPTEFKVAVPATIRSISACSGWRPTSLRSQRAPVRLEVVPVENRKDAMDALEPTRSISRSCVPTVP
jgi:hypothetical protein